LEEGGGKQRGKEVTPRGKVGKLISRRCHLEGGLPAIRQPRLSRAAKVWGAAGVLQRKRGKHPRKSLWHREKCYEKRKKSWGNRGIGIRDFSRWTWDIHERLKMGGGKGASILPVRAGMSSGKRHRHPIPLTRGLLVLLRPYRKGAQCHKGHGKKRGTTT